MTDERRSRRSSTPRPARSRGGAGGKRPATGGLLQITDGTEPALGEVRFDEWFSTPMFESDPDERLEEMATARRGPMRLAASTFLRLNARASQVRRRAEPDLTPAPALDTPGAAPPPSGRSRATARSAKAGPAKAKGSPRGATIGKTAAAAAAKSNGKTRTDPAGPARARSTAARPRAATVATPPTRGRAKAAPPVRRAPSPAPSPAPNRPKPARAPGALVAQPREPLRRRFNAALDRWAEREAATQARLERMILPRRWQG